jgi:hypothetical protein
MSSIPIYFKDYGTTYVISTAPVSYHTIIIKAPALAAMMPDNKDLRILAQVNCVVHNKECSYFSTINNSFNMVFPVRN